MSSIICPTCNQDLRAQPHEGVNGEDCPQCGQGLFWRTARLHKRSNKACSRRVPRRRAKVVKPILTVVRVGRTRG